MLVAGSLIVAVVLLALQFVLDLQRPQSAPSGWLRALSGRTLLLIRTVILALALAALSLEYTSKERARIAAEAEAARLADQLDSLQRDNESLLDVNKTISLNLTDAIGKIAAALTYGKLGEPALDVGPHGTVEYGDVQTGQSVAKGFFARNVGVGSCEVEVSVSEVSGRGGFVASKTRFTVTALQREDFEVRFSPSQPGFYAATVTISGSAPCKYDTINLVGTAR